MYSNDNTLFRKPVVLAGRGGGSTNVTVNLIPLGYFRGLVWIEKSGKFAAATFTASWLVSLIVQHHCKCGNASFVERISSRGHGMILQALINI